MAGSATGMILFTKNTENIKPMIAPFQTVALKKPSFLQSIFRQNPEENALIELNNLIASGGIESISPETLENIEARYDLSLTDRFGLNLEEFYAVALNHYLANFKMSEQESAKLRQLATALRLNEKTTEYFHLEIGKLSYRKCFIITLNNGEFTKASEDYLKDIQQHLNLPEEAEKAISKEVRSQHLLDYFNKMVADQRVSPQEEAAFKQKAKSLNINPEHNPETRKQLKNFRQYWSLENEELAAIENIFEIQKSETCYLVLNRIQFYEPRSNRSKYGGTYDKLIDSGTLYLTQKRILMIGLEKNYTIKLDNIIRAQKSSDGMTIHKMTGRNPTIKASQHELIQLAILLKRLGIYKN